MTDYVIMPKADYQGACDAIRAKTGKTDLIKSGDMATEIEEMQTGGGDDALKCLEGGHEEVNTGAATKIKNYAFYKDTTLKKVTMPNATSVGTYAFQSDSKITSVNAPKLRSVETYAFNGCTNMGITVSPDGLTSIGTYAFANCSNITNVSLGEGLSVIPSNAFASCSKLALTSLPESVTEIGASAFTNCTKLALTSLPSSLTKIGSQTFTACEGLKISVIPKSVTTISNNAFYLCSKIISLTFEGGTNLSSYAFLSLSYLRWVRFKGIPTTLNANSFGSCSALKLIKVPWAEGAVANAPWGAKNATIIYDYNPTDESEISFTVGIDNATYTAISGMTWWEFVYSDYNADGLFSIDSDGVVWRSVIKGGAAIRVCRVNENYPETQFDVIEEGYIYWNGNA